MSETENRDRHGRNCALALLLAGALLAVTVLALRGESPGAGLWGGVDTAAGGRSYPVSVAASGIERHARVTDSAAVRCGKQVLATRASCPNDGTRDEADSGEGGEEGGRRSGENEPLGSNCAVFDYYAVGPQITYLNRRTGEVVATANERYPRGALSLAKLYIADYVFEHGNASQRRAARIMVENSSDPIADGLYEDFPESITKTAVKYGLRSTMAGEDWGYSLTSTFDLVSFLNQLLEDDPDGPVLEAMRAATPVAADGYQQDFGTAVLDGAEGTKWGWSNASDQHASITFGKDYIVAAMVSGTADDLTAIVREQFVDVIGVRPEATGDAAGAGESSGPDE